MMAQDGLEHGSGGGRGAGASRVYVCPPRDQMLLMPVSMRDWLDEDHLAWFVIDVVAEMDTRGLHVRPGGAPGRPPYCPEMMCALLLYSYCCGVRSSRRIEAGCRTDAALRVICGGLEPDHATIARFAADQAGALAALFVAGLRLCAAAGLADLSVVALDGTKMAADAAIDQNRGAAWIGREVDKLLAATAAGEQSVQPRLDGQGAPAQPRGPRRLGRLRAALAVIEAEEAAETAAAAKKAEAAMEGARRGRKPLGRPPKDPAAALAYTRAEHHAALARAQAKQQRRARKVAAADAAGRRLGGFAPGPDRALANAQVALEAAERAAEQAEPAAGPQVNITDPDSRIMKTQKGWLQGYNAQAIVNKHHIVLACEAYQDAGDVLLYEPMTAVLDAALTAAGITGAVGLKLADAGYWSDENATAAGPDRLIATTKDHKRRRAARELGQATGPPPEDACPADAMEHRLRTTEGAAAYAQRGHTVEPVFGNTKHNRGMRGFRRRGLPAAKDEWAFINLAGNMLKLRQYRASTASTATLAPTAA